jgi:hypothetical protein
VTPHTGVINHRVCEFRLAATTFQEPTRHFYTKERPYASWVVKDIHENPYFWRRLEYFCRGGQRQIRGDLRMESDGTRTNVRAVLPPRTSLGLASEQIALWCFPEWERPSRRSHTASCCLPPYRYPFSPFARNPPLLFILT